MFFHFTFQKEKVFKIYVVLFSAVQCLSELRKHTTAVLTRLTRNERTVKLIKNSQGNFPKNSGEKLKILMNFKKSSRRHEC